MDNHFASLATSARGVLTPQTSFTLFTSFTLNDEPYPVNGTDFVHFLGYEVTAHPTETPRPTRSNRRQIKRNRSTDAKGLLVSRNCPSTGFTIEASSETCLADSIAYAIEQEPEIIRSKMGQTHTIQTANTFLKKNDKAAITLCLKDVTVLQIMSKVLLKYNSRFSVVAFYCQNSTLCAPSPFPVPYSCKCTALWHGANMCEKQAVVVSLSCCSC